MRDAAAAGAFPPPQFFADKPYEAARFMDERQAVEWLRHRQGLTTAGYLQ